MTEQQLQLKIMSALKPFYFVKVVSASKAGTPDIIGCKSGKFIAIECKSEKGKMSNLQDYYGKRIFVNGGFFYVARPSTYKLVLASILYSPENNFYGKQSPQ
jgi:hypothetical protein